ncbi:hypothetical protein [Roseivirga sp.]|uniref:hypothetical protein n=1 Tax=Roseivirga sp. TaxID=1964215 RepID=UPI003B8EA53F
MEEHYLVNQRLKKLILSTNTILVIGFIIYSLSRNDFIPEGYIGLSLIPLGINFGLFLYAGRIAVTILDLKEPIFRNKIVLSLIGNLLTTITLLILVVLEI